ncbi:hypothetical protein E8E11_005557 [Didymella keratinophila]|nr:hypothetical protein E8E11_005557 [Didymella keratinophila]
MSTGLHVCTSAGDVSQPGHDIFSTPENNEFYAAYNYEQLDPSKREIRLLRILPDRGDGTVRCDLLIKAPLDSATNTYSALSYCAGDPKRTRCIVVNGRKFRAFANLAHALAEARFFWKKTHGARELFLWVDQICIDQRNLHERSQQVGLMREIYSCAEEVLICLSTRKISGRGMHWLHDLCRNVPRREDDLDEQYRGESSFTLTLAVPFVRFHWSRLTKHLLESVANAKFVEDWLAVYDMFESPWWTRAWVYQEFMSATKARFLFSKESIAWATASPILDTYLSVVRHLILADDLFFRIQETFGASSPEYHRMLRIRERSSRAEQAEGLVAWMVESKSRWFGPTDLVRTITSKDVGLKVLREAPAAADGIDIVAVHGLGAHPDDSWCQNAGRAEEPRWRNWLIEDDMLPADVPFRPLLFVAHCFGGLVVLKALSESEQYPKEWPGVYSSTTGLVFFGTPFRSAEGMNQMEMLEAARREYHNNQVQPAVLEVLQPGNAYLQDLVDRLLKKLRGQANKTRIVCFFELKSSNVGRIVGKQDRTRLLVSQHAGCLDLSESTDKRSLSRTHFYMNKFEDAEEEDFETVAEVMQSMVKASPHLMLLSRHDRHDKLAGV